MDENLILIKTFIDILVKKAEPIIISSITNIPIKSHLPFFITKEILIYYKESCGDCNIKCLSKEILDSCNKCKLKYCEGHIFKNIDKNNTNTNEFELLCKTCGSKSNDLTNIKKCIGCKSFRGNFYLNNNLYCLDCIHK